MHEGAFTSETQRIQMRAGGDDVLKCAFSFLFVWKPHHKGIVPTWDMTSMT